MNLLITGANRGLGLKLTETALERGHRMFAGVRTLPPGGTLASLIARYPDRVIAVKLDVTREEDAAALAERLRSEGEALDVVINNAGVLLERGVKLEDLSTDAVEETFDINLFGPIRVAKHMFPLMRQGGMLLNISSEAGCLSNAYDGDYPYALSKVALNYFSKQLKAHDKPRGVRVFAVHPGWIKTDMGGENAPGDPQVTADGILDIVEGKTAVSDDLYFINHRGEPMPL
jgi:NAD(P)-dependent dehydrogenase (short-subunit alcohol dehydrogenase family)